LECQRRMQKQRPSWCPCLEPHWLRSRATTEFQWIRNLESSKTGTPADSCWPVLRIPSGGCPFQFGFLENESEFVLHPYGMCLFLASHDDAGNSAIEISAGSAACLVLRITRHLHRPHLHSLWLALEHRATTPDRSEPWPDGYSGMHHSAGRFDGRPRSHVASAQRG